MPRFNPRTREGCDLIAALRLAGSLKRRCFNPRTREGCDHCRVITRGDHVSIHAPARGATIHRAISCESFFTRFNPRTREGCDFERELTALDEATCFNPRTREGCDTDCNARWLTHRYIVSIHAPARGATPISVIILTQHIGFNPRTREGCDDEA